MPSDEAMVDFQILIRDLNTDILCQRITWHQVEANLRPQ